MTAIKMKIGVVTVVAVDLFWLTHSYHNLLRNTGLIGKVFANILLFDPIRPTTPMTRGCVFDDGTEQTMPTAVLY